MDRLVGSTFPLLFLRPLPKGKYRTIGFCLNFALILISSQYFFNFSRFMGTIDLFIIIWTIWDFSRINGWEYPLTKILIPLIVLLILLKINMMKFSFIFRWVGYILTAIAFFWMTRIIRDIETYIVNVKEINFSNVVRFFYLGWYTWSLSIVFPNLGDLFNLLGDMINIVIFTVYFRPLLHDTDE